MNAVARTHAVPVCPYCSMLAKFLASSESVYHGRDFGPLWICIPCEAWVGCHTGSSEPLGGLADKALRQAKMAVHAAFDPLWQVLTPAYPDLLRPSAKIRSIARGRAYQWLAKQLGISSDECHVGMFDLARCEEAVRVIQWIKPNSATIREWFKAARADVVIPVIQEQGK